MRETDTTNLVAIVTGGGRGIGRGCARALANAGFDIALVDVLAAEMEITAKEVRAAGRRAMCLEADVADHARAKAVAKEVVTTFGRIDFLLNNAGRAQPKGILEISEAEFDGTINLNLKGCFNYIQAVVPQMQAQGGGRIVSMSSLNALSGGVTAAVSRFAYASAKAGILGMTRALAKELGPEILVNAICPGLIRTEIAKNHVIVERGEELARNGIALGRVGSVEDVAQVVVFLASSQPCFVTGQHFVVDGFQYNV
jgi:3-oxoacyl-[acyl-carrier protein] reductase